MTIYTDVFGGANIYPSEVSYSLQTMMADVYLSWPEETSANGNLATKIIDVSAAAGLSIHLPDARKAANGETILFNNVGSNTVTIKTNTGVQVVTVAAGQLYQIYLTDNSTQSGTWKSLQYGASVSQANASSLAGTGIVAVGTLLSQSVPITTFNTDYTAGANDRAKMFVWNGAGGTFTLPSAPAIGNNWFCYLRNAGSGAVVADPSGTPTIDGLPSLSFQPGESAIIATDGVNFYTIGFGQSATFAFDYTSINVSGTGNYTLSGSELNRIAYDFTGTLTGDRNIVVPATVQQYWVSNGTSGAYNLTIKTSAGVGVTIVQGSRTIVYCNGTDVVLADTGGVSVPISIINGGTGATNAGSALINLGGTSTGVALFTAVDQDAAYSALGRAPAGVVEGGVF